MNANFTKYVKERLQNPNVESSVEKQLISAVDRYDLEGTVKLLYLYRDSSVLYKAYVSTESTPKRVTIEEIGEDLPHSISSLLNADLKAKRGRSSLFSYDVASGKWVYDEYFSKYLNLGNVLSELFTLLKNWGFNNSDTVIIFENYYNEPVVEFALQTLVKKAINAIGHDNDVSIKGRVHIKKSLLTQHIGVNFPMDSIWGLITNKENIYVPLHGSSLSSKFYHNHTWENILGDLSHIDGYVVDVAGCPCRLLRLSPYIDCYGNIFLSVYSPLDKRSNYLLIDGPGVECLNQSENYSKSRNSTVSGNEDLSNADNRQLPVFNEKPSINSQTRSKRPKISSQNESVSSSSEESILAKENTDIKQSDNLFHSHKEIIFMERTIRIGAMDSQIPKASIGKLKGMLETIEAVFKEIAGVERIVTDTNLWITEDTSHRGKMLYENMLNFMNKFMKKGHNLYELHRQVFDEIVKLAIQNKAAAKHAKTYLSDCQERRLLEIVDLDWDTNWNPYADPIIGERVIKHYKEGTSFSIITNDADAKIRWVNALQQLEKEISPENRRTFPPCILSRDLYSIYLLRGKLIARLKQLENK